MDFSLYLRDNEVQDGATKTFPRGEGGFKFAQTLGEFEDGRGTAKSSFP
jgi:hypothetical protein